MIAVEVFPRIAISAVDPELTLRGFIVFLDDVPDHADDTMGAAATSPTQVANSVVAASIARVTLALHRISGNRTYGGKTVA
jgi:hypothetical protein